MGRHRLAGLVITVMTAGAALVAGASAAAAADPPAHLFVNRAKAGCSDTGPGTEAQPFCRIGPALALAVGGGTIHVTPGLYPEHLTFPRSGEVGRPITLRPTTDNRIRLGNSPDAGLTIDGRHDLVIDGVQTTSSLDVSNASRITIQNTVVQQSAADAVRLVAVTDSALRHVQVSGGNATGISLGAGTSGVTVIDAQVAGHRAIEVLGSRNTIRDSDIAGDSPVLLAAGAEDNVLVNNDVFAGAGVGLDNAVAGGTAITNNRITSSCVTAVRVAGASTGVSVQNNIVTHSSQTCDEPAGPEITIADDAVGHTVVDYNSVFHGTAGASDLYSYNGAVLGLAGFRTASGQGAHDSDGPTEDTVEDAANSAAPGWPGVDALGNQPEDNPARPDTGAGPIPYADRGPRESVKGPQATLSVRPDYAANSVAADGSGSTPGFSPIVTYSFAWGDGTVTNQATATASHHYAQPGNYMVMLTVTDAHGHQWNEGRSISLWPAVRTIALLSHDNNRYVTGGPEGYNFLTSNVFTGAIGASELLEVVEPGNGHVALRSPINGTYIYVNQGVQPLLSAGDPQLDDDWALFDLTTAADGTVSLWSVGRKAYVSSNSGSTQVLAADRATVGPWERFGVVDKANAGVTLKARVNNRYVTADNGGSSPLIANRTAAGQWETFDLVDAGDGWVALYSRADNLYVTAESGGNAPLIANRSTIGAWERFTVARNADGSISLQAGANGRWVCADGAGGLPLIANRTTPGGWEAFN